MESDQPVGKIEWQVPEQLTLEQIAKMDGGRLGEAVKQALVRIASDMEDRPGEQRPRTLTLKMGFVPEIEPDGTCSGCKFAVAVEEKVPSRKSKPFNLGLRRKRGAGVFLTQPMPLFDEPDDL